MPKSHEFARFFRTKRSNFFAGLLTGAARFFQANYGGLLLQFQLLDHRIFFWVTKKSSGFWHQTRFESFLSMFEYMVN